MLIVEKNNKIFYDSSFGESEQIPRSFRVSFQEVNGGTKVLVKVNDNQTGDVISDNSHESDYYRYHDIFHYAFATLLGWSPCTRSMMRRKRKSIPIIDEIEDGARATITEEAISLMLFSEAKTKGYLKKRFKINRATLKIIKRMTENFEVKDKSFDEWEAAIQKGYEIFRKLVANKGGRVYCDMVNHTMEYHTQFA